MKPRLTKLTATTGDEEIKRNLKALASVLNGGLDERNFGVSDQIVRASLARQYALVGVPFCLGPVPANKFASAGPPRVSLVWAQMLWPSTVGAASYLVGVSMWGDIVSAGTDPDLTLQHRVLVGPVVTTYRLQALMVDDTHYIYSQAQDDSSNPEGLAINPGDALEVSVDTKGVGADYFRTALVLAWVKVPLTASTV